MTDTIMLFLKYLLYRYDKVREMQLSKFIKFIPLLSTEWEHNKWLGCFQDESSGLNWKVLF